MPDGGRGHHDGADDDDGGGGHDDGVLVDDGGRGGRDGVDDVDDDVHDGGGCVCLVVALFPVHDRDYDA